MKTLKALKISTILQTIFCLFCVASTVCFAINHFYDVRIFFTIGTILMYGWIINPIAIISFVVCLVLLLREYKHTESKQVLRKKWIWIFVWPIITIIFYIIAAASIVFFTGGV